MLLHSSAEWKKRQHDVACRCTNDMNWSESVPKTNSVAKTSAWCLFFVSKWKKHRGYLLPFFINWRSHSLGFYGRITFLFHRKIIIKGNMEVRRGCITLSGLSTWRHVRDVAATFRHKSMHSALTLIPAQSSDVEGWRACVAAQRPSFAREQKRSLQFSVASSRWECGTPGR